MTRDFKPGEFAFIDSWRGENQFAVRVHRGLDCLDWCVLDATDTRGLMAEVITSARPALVIDPESEADVQRLCDAYKSVDHSVGTMWMQAALRSLIEPPKPEEPTGLGAVVEDAEGNQFVRIARGRWGWVEANGMLSLSSRCQREQPGVEWEDISAVRVLADGWQGESDE
jgi:hypothetical protein